MLDEIRVLLHIPPADFLLVFVCIMYVRFGQILGQAILGHPCRGGHCIAGRSVASPTGVTTPPCQKCNGIPCRHGDGNADVAQAQFWQSFRPDMNRQGPYTPLVHVWNEIRPEHGWTGVSTGSVGPRSVTPTPSGSAAHR